MNLYVETIINYTCCDRFIVINLSLIALCGRENYGVEAGAAGGLLSTA